MWRFRDRDERLWDVVVGRESWGAFYAIFVPRGQEAEIRQTPLDAGSHADANEVMDALDRESWRRLFEASTPKPTG